MALLNTLSQRFKTLAALLATSPAADLIGVLLEFILGDFFLILGQIFVETTRSRWLHLARPHPRQQLQNVLEVNKSGLQLAAARRPDVMLKKRGSHGVKKWEKSDSNFPKN